MASIIGEYHVYADPKARLWDEILLGFFEEQSALSTVLQDCLPAEGIIPKSILDESLERSAVIIDTDMIDVGLLVDTPSSGASP